MKNTYIIFFIIIFLFNSIDIFAEIKFKVKVSSLEIKKISAKSYSVKFYVKYKGLFEEFFEDSTVPIPVEELIIEGEFSNLKIKEMDFLFAGIDIDINGDKDFKDSYKLKYNSNNYYLDNYKLKISSSGKKNNNYNIYNYYDKNGEPLLNKYGENSFPFIIYNIDYYSKKMIVGINRGEKPVEIKPFKNPNIQVILIKPVDSINKKISFSIGSSTNFYAYSNEKIIPGNDDKWNGIAWIVKEMQINKSNKNYFNLSLNNITPPFALMVVPNLTMEKGIRIRMRPGVRILNIK